jgi:hypothetical protein
MVKKNIRANSVRPVRRRHCEMDEEEQYAMIRKEVYNQRFITWMEKSFLEIDSKKIENKTTALYEELQKMLERKPLIPVLVALCEATCKTYQGIVGDKKKS